MTAGYSHASPVPCTNNEHDNVFVFDGADNSIRTDMVFPQTFEAFPKRIIEPARILFGRYFFSHIANDDALALVSSFLGSLTAASSHSTRQTKFFLYLFHSPPFSGILQAVHCQIVIFKVIDVFNDCFTGIVGFCPACLL